MRENVKRLLTVVLALMLMSAGDCALAGAEATLALPAELKIIEEEAFYGNASLEKVIVADGTTEIRSKAFAGSSLTELVLPGSLTYIAEDAFKGCGEIVLTVPENCYAYDRCVELGLIRVQEPAELESAHPYADDFDYTWTYDAGEGTESITITFSNKTETEEGYDFIYFYTLDDEELGKYSGTELAGRSITIDGAGFKLRLTSDEAWDSSNTYYGFRVDSIEVKKAVPLAFDSITAENSTVTAGEPICWTVVTTGGKEPVYYDYAVLLGEKEMASGTVEAPGVIEYTPARVGEYRLSVVVRDSNEAVLPTQVSEAVTAAPSTAYPESAHPYTANTDQSWIYAAEENVESLIITFSEETKTQSKNDFIWLYDQDGIQVGKYSGTELAGQTIEIMGTAVTIRLTSNGSTHDYGFSITNIEKYIPNPLSFVSLTVNKSKAQVGELITWTMETEGGRRPVTYEYTITLNDEVQYAGSVTRPEQIEYVPVAEGDYTMSVVARDAEGDELPAQTSRVRITQREATPEEYFTYEAIDGLYARITGYTGDDTAVIVPETIGEYTVREIGDGAFRDNATLLSVRLPDTVTKVAANAFRNCDALRSVELGQGVTSVGANAFYDCDALRVFVFPDSVTTTGGSVLRYCDQLAEVTFPVNWTSAGEYTIADCPRLTSIELPEGMTAVPNYAFRYSANLKEIVLPDTLLSIGQYAFGGCTGVKSIEFPEGLTSIAAYAFENCTGFMKITLPSTVTSVSGFAGCTNLSQIGLNQGLVSIGDDAFKKCTALTNIDFPTGLETVGINAFQDCTNLQAAMLPDTVTGIGNNAFDNCTSMSRFNYPASFEKVIRVNQLNDSKYGFIFKGCKSLKEITVPEGVTTIPEYTFRGAEFITKFNLPSTLTSIGRMAFSACKGIQNIEFPAHLETIDISAFSNCTNLQAAILPDSVTGIGNNAFENCTSLSEFRYPANFTRVIWVGMLNDSSYGHIFKGCTTLKVINVPEGITSIPPYTFRGCEYLTEINVPDTVTTIGKMAFSGCKGLQSFEFPAHLETIDISAFSNCTNLQAAILPDSVTGIGNNAFENCTSLSEFRYPAGFENVIKVQMLNDSTYGYLFKGCTSLTEITIPEGVTTIPAYTFRGAPSITKVHTPSTLTTVGQKAFEGCTIFEWIYLSPLVQSIGGESFAKCPALTIWTEYGAYALQHAIDKGIAYYYLTPDGVNIPSGRLYKGDSYYLYGYARASVPLTDVTATIWDSTGTKVIQTISVNPGVLDYSLSGTVNASLLFSELPLGSYRYTLSAKTDVSEELWANSSFTIVPPPLRVHVTGLEALTGAVSNDFAFGGMIYANYPMTNITLTLKSVSTDKVWTNFSCAPNTTSYSLTGTTGVNFAQLPTGNYQLTIAVSGNGETKVAVDAFFSIGAYDQQISNEVFDQLVSFVGDPNNQMIFNRFNEGSAFLSSLDWSDSLFMSIHFRSEMFVDTISQLLTSDKLSRYMVKQYKSEVAAIIDDIDPQTDLTGSDAIYIDMIESMASNLRIVAYVDKGSPLVSDYMKQISKSVNEQLDKLDKVCTVANWVVDAKDYYSEFLQNFENSLMILEAYSNYTATTNPELKAAIEELAEDYTSKVSKAMNLMTNLLIDNMSKQMYSGALKLFEVNTSLANKLITGSAGNYSIMLTITNFAIDATLELNNLDKIADNQMNAMIQLETFGQAVDSYRHAFTAVYEGDTSAYALNRLGICYQLCCSAGTRMYESLAKTAWYEKNFEGNDAFMSKYAELWRLEYAEPFDHWR